MSNETKAENSWIHLNSSGASGIFRMAQFYQVTSLEELHRLYPNLQLDKLEGIPCMIQEEQTPQYSDESISQLQAQQVVTAVKQPEVENVAQQCSSQPQYVVHQPSQYVIRQMKSNECHPQSVEYIDQNQHAVCKKNESTEFHQINNEESLVQQCIMNQDNNQQFLSQVQSIQIHQPIQAVDMGGNILVLQNQDQQNMLINSNNQNINEGEKIMQHPLDLEHQQHQQQHVIIQGSSQKNELISPSIPQIIHNEEIPQCGSPQSVLESRFSQGGNEQQIVAHQSQQQIIQPVQYFNQVTVIDNLSQPNVTIEHHTSMDKNVEHSHQFDIQNQIQRSGNPDQHRPRKSLHQNVPPVPPQKYEIASPNRIPQIRKKDPQDKDTAPLLIVQKVDSSFLTRQSQSRTRFQSPSLNIEKVNETTFQNSSAQSDVLIPGNLRKIPQSVPKVTQTEILTKTGRQSPNKFFAEVKNPDHFSGNKTGEKINKMQTIPVSSSKTPISKNKTTEQQTDPVIIEYEDIPGKQYEQLISNTASDTKLDCFTNSGTSSQTPLRGRMVKGAPYSSPQRAGHQYTPQRGRGIQVQTSSPCPPNVEDVRRLKSSCMGINRGARGGCIPSGIEQRPAGMRLATPQAIQTVVSKNEGSVSNENLEETRMVVLLFNGEKKVVRIPCSQQSMLLSQVLQQAGLQFSTPTSIAIEQVMDLPVRPTITQGSTLSNSSGTPKSIVATIHSQRPRVQSANAGQNSPVGIIRQRVQYASPRMGSPQTVSDGGIKSQNSASPQPQKEEPRFVNGFMAICPFCGISSLDFNKCIRCRRKLPENVKSQSIFNAKKNKENQLPMVQ